jgi:cobalt-zinc-cadmium efflux system protein
MSRSRRHGDDSDGSLRPGPERPEDHRGHAHAGHAHGQGSEGASVGRLVASLAVTAGIMVAEALGGWASGSLALVSDAGHMLTDVAALGLAVCAAWLSARPADDKRTYGYRRVEVLAAQINVGALFVLSIWIGWEAVQRLRVPGPPIRLGLMSVVAAVGLLANLVTLWLLNRERSLNARSAFLHVLSDAISSVAILCGAAAMALRPGIAWLDPVLSLGIAGLILWGVSRLVLEVTDILMESVPRHIDVLAVSRQMECCAGVMAVHDLHVWSISSGMHALSAHLVVRTEEMGRNDAILEEVKRELRHGFGIDHTTLQIESSDYDHVYDRAH